jgi:site-specific DNA-methyltransferase (adenine-specific)
MLGIIKNTQNTMKKSYSFIPMQDFSESWTDEKLFKKYKLTKSEIEIIESSIKREIR